MGRGATRESLIHWSRFLGQCFAKGESSSNSPVKLGNIAFSLRASVFSRRSLFLFVVLRRFAPRASRSARRRSISSWGVRSSKGMSETMKHMREGENATSTNMVRGRRFSGEKVQVGTRAPLNDEICSLTFCEGGCTRRRMGRAKNVLLFSFCGTNHKNTASLYAVARAIRDGSDSTFEASSEELCRILRAAGELPTEPSRTLRLHRMRASVRSSTYYELIADLSDSTSTGKLSLKKACRFAFKP